MKISIEKTEDGMFTVSTGGSPEMTPEMGVMEAEQGTGQTFESFDEAIEAVRAAFGGGEQAQPMMEGEQEFVAGFKQARGGEGQGF